MTTIVEGLEHIKSRVITSIILDHEDANPQRLRLVFDDGAMLTLENDYQCCESRFMRTDDDLRFYSGATLLGIELRSGPDSEEDGEYLEVQFLVITTTKGTFTIANHNMHNGYYSGFDLECEVTP